MCAYSHKKYVIFIIFKFIGGPFPHPHLDLPMIIISDLMYPIRLHNLSTQFYQFLLFCSYLVSPLMGADLNNIIKTQRLSDDHVQFLVYQILRGMKVSVCNDSCSKTIVLFLSGHKKW